MHRLGIDPGGLSGVVLSHLHGDHFGGLPFLLLDAAFITSRQRPLIVLGPAGTAERVRRATEALFPGFWRTSGARQVRFLRLVDRQVTPLAGARVTPFRVVHLSGAPAYALRVSCHGCTVAYSGDTAWTPALIDAADNSDLFLCEASSFNRPVPYHLSYTIVEAHRAAFRTSRLMLTHLGPDVISRVRRLPIECARDGQLINLRPKRR
jgi:ribonuclease BN (tRNA processing enzyme)